MNEIYGERGVLDIFFSSDIFVLVNTGHGSRVDVSVRSLSSVSVPCASVLDCTSSESTEHWVCADGICRCDEVDQRRFGLSAFALVNGHGGRGFTVRSATRSTLRA